MRLIRQTQTTYFFSPHAQKQVRKDLVHDAILLLGLSPEIELVSRQAKQLQLKIPLPSIESFGLSSNIAEFEGSWFVDSAMPTGEFLSRYQKKFGVKATPGVSHAYDSVKMLQVSF